MNIAVTVASSSRISSRITSFHSALIFFSALMAFFLVDVRAVFPRFPSLPFARGQSSQLADHTSAAVRFFSVNSCPSCMNWTLKPWSPFAFVPLSRLRLPSMSESEDSSNSPWASSSYSTGFRTLPLLRRFIVDGDDGNDGNAVLSFGRATSMRVNPSLFTFPNCARLPSPSSLWRIHHCLVPCD